MAEKKAAASPAKGAGKEKDIEGKERDRKATGGAAPPKKKSRGLLKFIAVLALLLILAGSAVGAGIYFKLIDVPGLVAKYKLREYPLVGKYLPQPATNFETVDLPPESEAKDKAAPPTAAKAAPALPPAATPEELKANLAKAKQEEIKRISRLARLYGEMKADEAVPIMNQLDDPTILAILGKMEDSQAAKILAQLDAKKAARLTQDMLKGKTAGVTEQDIPKGKPN